MSRNRKKYRKELEKSNNTFFDFKKSPFPEKCSDYGYEILNENYSCIEDFIACLNNWAKIPDVKVYNYIEPRPKDGTEGIYHSSSQGKPEEIEIWLLTTAKKLVGGEEMLRIVIEEWLHHFDNKYLKLSDSHHCKGFFKRLDQILKQFRIR